MEDEFVIPVSKLVLLEQYGTRICRLFGVSVAEVPSQDGQEPHAWIRVSSRNSEQDVQRAREYIVSLVSEDTQSRPEIESRYDSEHFEILLQHRDKIEASSRAVVNFSPANLSIRIRGLPMHIQLAQSYIENLIHGCRPVVNQRDDQLKGFPAHDIGCIPGGSVGNQFRSRGDVSTARGIGAPSSMSPLSPGAESRDSCYDSGDDMVNCGEILSSNLPSPDFNGPRKSNVTSPTLNMQNINVSTLADRNTCRTSSSPVSQQGQGHSGSGSSSSSDPELDRIHSDTMAKEVDFGIKLGYEESQVLSALRKLGPCPSTDQLLAELVSLGKSSSATLQMEGDIVPDCSLDMSIHSPILPAAVLNSLSPNTSSTGLDPSQDWTQKSLGLDPSESVPDEDVLYPRPSDSKEADTEYRYIVIDGSNVAMSHGNKERFSCLGIKLAVDWFRQKGCQNITVFVPQWRKESSRPDAQITDQHILAELEKEQILSFTPARRIGGKRMVCYDDRYVVKLALDEDGIIVSNDNYRDLQTESPEFKRIVEERLLMYSFVRDKFMPPEDPLGRYGPSLENFLRKQPTAPEANPIPCPYGKKCTYGNKCKYHHPERGNLPHKSVTDKLAEERKQKMLEVRERGRCSEEKRKSGHKKRSSGSGKTALTRTDSVGVSGERLDSGGVMPPPVPPRIPKAGKGNQELPPLPIVTPAQPDILVSPSKDQDPEYKAYNEKLNEYRKKIEIHEKTARDADAEIQSNVVEQAVHPGYIDPAPWSQPGIQSPARGSPAREQLVCGHLLVAQTLSDEANRQQRQKDMKGRNPSPSSRATDIHRQQQELKQSLLQQQQLQQYRVNAASQQNMQEPMHQRLSRQLSIQDPRPNSSVRSPYGQHIPASGPFHHHSDPRQFYGQTGGHRSRGTEFRPEVSAYDRGPYYHSSGDATHLTSYPGAFPSRQTSYGGEYPDVFSDHSDLARTTSDTVHLPVLANAPGFQPMRRQNSTSDPLLNSSGVHHPSGSGGPMVYAEHPSNLSSDERPASQPTHYQPQQALPATDHYALYQGRYPGLYDHGYPDPFGQYSQFPSTPPIQTPTHTAPVMMPSNPHIRSSYPPDATIDPADPRYSLYYHLCGLFEEPKVRAVMNRHPLETNPRVLCQYLVSIT